MHDQILVVPFLDYHGCHSVYDSLTDLRAEWIDRNPKNPDKTFTVGIATYLDATSPGECAERYTPAVGRSNEILYQKFSAIYEQLRTQISSVMVAPARFPDDLALPGFHIFRGQGMAHFGQIKPHFDCQYQRHTRFAHLQNPQAISFTLPIRLPRGGGGLDVWDMTLTRFNEDCSAGRLKNMDHYTQTTGHETLFYSLGNLVTHRNLILHRIAGTAEPPTDNDERITLQGHGIKERDGAWILYW